jgi:cation transport ATPase
MTSTAGHHTDHSAHQAHDKHAGHSVAMFRDKFWLSLLLTIPVVLLSEDVSTWFGYSVPAVAGIEYVPAVLGTVVFLYGGLVFIRGAVGELRDRQPGMMTLISLAILVAFVTSWAGTLGLFEVEIWWELATLITIMLLGHWLEMRSIAQAQALATADVGIAIGAGTEVAVESAGIILVRSDPRDVANAIELSRATYRKMVQNLVWATGYNVLAIRSPRGCWCQLASTCRWRSVRWR